jgi:transcription elongation factor GreA
MAREIPITRDGKKRLEEELEELKTVRRQEVATHLSEARDFAAFENTAAFDEAKNEQTKVENRIREIEGILESAVLIDEDKAHAAGRVEIGSGVRYRQKDREMHAHIVGAPEADPAHGRISNESPIGKALLGKRKGDVVQVTVPSGVVEFEILEID